MSVQKTYFRAIPIIGSFFALLISLFLQVPTASAIPSYARQTGFPCKSCHYMPPELTPLGRAFKLNGYTMAGKPTVTSNGTSEIKGSGDLGVFPAFGDYSILPSPLPNLHNRAPRTATFQFPQDASLFLAGAWAHACRQLRSGDL